MCCIYVCVYIYRVYVFVYVCVCYTHTYTAVRYPSQVHLTQEVWWELSQPLAGGQERVDLT